jgi:hypothetical protein
MRSRIVTVLFGVGKECGGWLCVGPPVLLERLAIPADSRYKTCSVIAAFYSGFSFSVRLYDLATAARTND